MRRLDGEILGDLAPRGVVFRQIRIEQQLVGVNILRFADLRQDTPTLVGATASRRLDGSTEAADLGWAGFLDDDQEITLTLPLLSLETRGRGPVSCLVGTRSGTNAMDARSLLFPLELFFLLILEYCSVLSLRQIPVLWLRQRVRLMFDC